MSENDNTTQPTTEQPTFGIQDLVFTMQVYEASAQRGAFRAEEMATVGAVYDRLRAFLISSGAIANPVAPVETTEESN